jgi:hypothetical protein
MLIRIPEVPMRDLVDFGGGVYRQRKTMLLAVVAAALATGLFSQAVYAQGNPAAFINGVYAFADSNSSGAGDVPERFSFIGSGNNVTMSGGGLPGQFTGTFTSLASQVGSAEAAAVGAFNAAYSQQGMWRYWATCTVVRGTECAQLSFAQMYDYMPTSEQTFIPPVYTAILTLIDQNADGASDAIQLSGRDVPNTTVNLVQMSSEGRTFISIPWALAGALGVKGNYPPVFIPLSSGRIILDLDGDGVPDPTLLTSPPLAGAPLAPTVPTLSEWGMIFLTLLLMVGGIAVLRRSRVQISLS